MNQRPMQIIHDLRILSRHTGDMRKGLKALQAQGIGGAVTNMPFDNYMQVPVRGSNSGNSSGPAAARRCASGCTTA